MDELHAVREQLLEESGGTLAGLVAKLQAEQNASDRTIIKTERAKHCIEVVEQSLPEDGATAATQ